MFVAGSTKIKVQSPINCNREIGCSRTAAEPMKVPVILMCHRHASPPSLSRHVLNNGGTEWYKVDPEDMVRSLLLQIEAREAIRVEDVCVQSIIIETEE